MTDESREAELGFMKRLVSRAESDARVAKEVAAAREGAEREARESYRIREEEIESGFPKSLPPTSSTG